MEIKAIFGSRIKEIRTKKKMTQQQLADFSGIERTFISHIESGSKNVSIETMERLFAGLGIGFNHFFNSDVFK